ncbi:MAG TPA: cadherin-like beta sandwich domain-containing protein [Candidatus Limiplasma sp.]|nr:cadherin-like beta sandwich domain-containing protein [Candidatus Limiplasma sp.]HRX08726.1 cadherin-like beta sandwich domain-containing protein [Candidatus Limiplasma sp.]
MKKRILSILFVLALLALTIPAAQADFSETYYNLRLTQGYAVYTGPGAHYYRANGNAFYGGGVLRYYGTEPGGWLMIGYQTSGNTWRMGYIEPSAASNIKTDPADYSLFNITFTATPNYTSKNTYITDDPLFGDKTPLTDLLAGQMVTVLGRYNSYWVYVEVSKSGMQPMRGYIQSDALTTEVPSVTPSYYPISAPVVTPVPTPVVPVPSGLPYLSSLTHNAPNTGKMVPSAFSPGQTSYLLTVADWVSKIYFVPFSPNASTIYFNGTVVANGAQTPSITLSNNPTSAVFTLVGSGGATNTYTVYIQRRPSERRTRVSAGYIDSVYSSGNENHIRADLVTVTYTQGTNLSTFVNETKYLYDYACADDAIFYYGTMQNPIRAISFSDFISHYNMYGSTLYRIIYIEDKIVAVMPYNSDYPSP